MKVAHISLVVKDIDANVAFYTDFFGRPPKIQKPDYAKWELDDPRLNFSIDAHGDKPGVNHLGIEEACTDDVTASLDRHKKNGLDVFGEGQIVCGYHRSDKGWITDPQAVLWEVFYSPEITPQYGSTGEEVTEEVERRAKQAGLSG